MTQIEQTSADKIYDLNNLIPTTAPLLIFKEGNEFSLLKKGQPE
jgi:hypothetical protein